MQVKGHDLRKQVCCQNQNSASSKNIDNSQSPVKSQNIKKYM